MRLLALSIIAAVPVGIWGGCSGDGELSLAEYFRDTGALGNEYLDDLERLETELLAATEDVDTEEEAVSLFGEFMADCCARQREVIADLRSVEPPPEARKAHEEYIAIQIESSGFMGDLCEQSQQATSSEDVAEITDALKGPIASGIKERVVEACLVLQGIADDNNIDQDLGCLE